MAPGPARASIPVPQEHTKRRLSQRANQRPAGDPTQVPWRSSLDLVWSYSRSQAFYGANIATSPSFADRHWAGPSQGLADSSVDEGSEDFDDEDEDVDDDEDEEDSLQHSTSSLNYATRSRPQHVSKYGATTADEDFAAASPAGPMDWQDEQLPPNALHTRRGSMLGKRDKRSSSARSPRGSGRALDRRIRRLADDEEEDEERSRSRSRSPKRVNLSKPSGERSGTRTASESMAAGNVSFGESTPLLSDAQHHADLESAPGGRRSLLHMPSWLRNSHMSTSSSKFRMQGYGSSTFWQSWFNTVNALVGVGILALPLAISYAGLIPGIVMFILCGVITNYTGKVLANIMAAEPSLRTYADIGNLAFGTTARLFVSFFFCLELWAVATALVILFGDSLRALIVSSVAKGTTWGFVAYLAQWSPAAFKAVGVALVLPTMFLPLRLLSPISVVGIISVTTLFVVILSDGFIKTHAPGSLWDPIAPQLAPRWSRLPLSFGLIMSGFSSHPIIPSLFKDMRNPKEFRKMLNWAYIGATIIYLGMGLAGYLMFGQSVSDEITRDIAQTRGYPRILNKVAIWLIIINPLSKFALAARPVVTTLELLLGVEVSQTRTHADGDSPSSPLAQKPTTGGEHNGTSSSSALSLPDAMHDAAGNEHTLTDDLHAPHDIPLNGSTISLRAAQRTVHWSPQSKTFLRACVQVLVTLAIGLTAILLPGFEKVMAFLGAFLACATCIFGPLLANLSLLRHELSRTRIIIDVIILVVSFFIAILGTIWTFLPLH